MVPNAHNRTLKHKNKTLYLSPEFNYLQILDYSSNSPGGHQIGECCSVATSFPLSDSIQNTHKKRLQYQPCLSKHTIFTHSKYLNKYGFKFMPRKTKANHTI